MARAAQDEARAVVGSEGLDAPLLDGLARSGVLVVGLGLGLGLGLG